MAELCPATILPATSRYRNVQRLGVHWPEIRCAGATQLHSELLGKRESNRICLGCPTVA
jgi:hypothetical protein